MTGRSSEARRQMGGEALYERYKDALKRGHVASLRGRIEEALTAYAEAAAIAPERPTPHTSAGTALMRRRRPADALRHFSAALTLAPQDEAALLGRAQALAALDRRPEAADAFDAVAEVRASGGKLADAVDAARRGLELAEGRERRRTLEQLIERLRASEPGEPGRVALERALRVLDGAAVTGRARQDAAPRPAAMAIAESAATAAAADTAGEELAGGTQPGAPAPGPEPVAGPTSDTVPTGEGSQPGAAARTPGPSPAQPARAILDRDLPDDLDLVALARAVEDGLDAGTDDTFGQVLDLTAGYRLAGQLDAALDSCYLALSLDPDSVALHLALAELYAERGWGVLAAEKLDLLGRLAAFDGDAGAAAMVTAARTRPG